MWPWPTPVQQGNCSGSLERALNTNFFKNKALNLWESELAYCKIKSFPDP